MGRTGPGTAGPGTARRGSSRGLVPLHDRVEDHEEGVLLVRLGLVDAREAGPVREELVEVLGGPAREDHDPPTGDAATLRELEHLSSAEKRQVEIRSGEHTSELQSP